MTKTSRLELMHKTALLHCFRCFSMWWIILVLLMWLGASPVSAAEPQSSNLKAAVILVGANTANDALLRANIQPGAHDLDFYLLVNKALQPPLQGKLIVTKFLAQSPLGDVVTTTIRIPGASSSANDDAPVPVSLTASDVLHLRLAGGVFRPGTTYKGSLFLTAGGQINSWEITLTTGGRGIMAVDQIGTMKFSTLPLCGTSIGSFPVTLRDKSEGGPYHHVRVRFEPAGNPASKAITSNFNLDSFSFWETKDGAAQEIDLAQREENLPGITLDYHGQHTLTARLKPLSPGEYTGALRFVADESSDDATEAKLPVTIQIRHCWLLPVLVILFGSLVGWYSSKYVIGVRKARELARQVKELRARADDLARPDPPQDGWEFPGEVTSYGLARVRVQLSQLAQLASSALPILIREEELQQQRRDAELRVSALESLHSVRLRVQQVAAGRPAAQLALGRLLRGANDLIEGPTFDQTHQTALANLLKTGEAWLEEKTFDATYREALANRLTSQEIPGLSLLQALPEGEVQQQLEALLQNYCPTKAQILNQSTDLTVLQEYDKTMAKVALLWRDRDNNWATDLAKACGEQESIEDLFRIVDRKLWEELEKAAEADHQLNIERDSTDQGPLQTYDLVEVRLTSNALDLSDSRILHHPLRVRWRIEPPDHNVRSTENHDLTMAQYFPLPGQVKIQAALQWQGRKISLKEVLQLDIVPNPEFSKRRLLSGGFTEWAVIAIAAGFAVATAMATLYDPTFGSFSQYLALFIWAAGAGTGGNIFKQLGPSSTPGGQADVPLPTGAGGGATAGK